METMFPFLSTLYPLALDYKIMSESGCFNSYFYSFRLSICLPRSSEEEFLFAFLRFPISPLTFYESFFFFFVPPTISEWYSLQFGNFGGLERHGFARNRFWSLDDDPSPLPPANKQSSVDLILKSTEDDLKIWPHRYLADPSFLCFSSSSSMPFDILNSSASSLLGS